MCLKTDKNKKVTVVCCISTSWVGVMSPATFLSLCCSSCSTRVELFVFPRLIFCLGGAVEAGLVFLALSFDL